MEKIFNGGGVGGDAELEVGGWGVLGLCSVLYTDIYWGALSHDPTIGGILHC